MKRLLAQIGITYFSVLAVAFYLSRTAILSVGIAALAVMLLLIIIPKTRRKVYPLLMALTAAIACAVNLGYAYLVVEPTVQNCVGEKQEVTAVLKEEPYRSYTKYCYRLELIEAGGETAHGSLLLRIPENLDIGVDDTLRFTADIVREENDYYRSQGSFLRAEDLSARPEVESAQKHSLYYYAVQLRAYLRSAIDSLLPEDCAALCKAVFVGDKYALDLSIREEFRYAGASYFIVVSGMHFAVICAVLLKLMKKFNRWIRLTVMLFIIILYAAVTDFQPSVLRSGLMMAMTVIGSTVRRQAYPPNHLGFAGLALPLIVSPYGVGQIGLVLSFYATLSILLWATPIMEKLSVKDEFGCIYRFHPASLLHRSGGKKSKAGQRIKLFFIKIYNALIAMLSVSLSANILVFPITVFVFREFSTVTLLSSVLLYWPIYFILILTLAVCALFYLGPLRYAAAVLSWPLYLLCRWVLGLVGFLGELPFAHVYVRSLYVYIWLGVTVVLGGIVLLMRDRRHILPIAALCSAAVLLAGMISDGLIDMEALRLEIYAQGEGVCAGVNCHGQFHLLDTNAYGSELYDLLDRIDRRYAAAETVYCADYDDFERYYHYVDGKFAISRYLLYDRKGYTNGSGSIVGFRDDCTFVLDDDLVMRTAVEKNKAVVMLTAGEQTILLLPDRVTLADIPESMRRADIILLRRCFAGAEKLSCRDLIFCGMPDTLKAAADDDRPHYEQLYLTSEGDLTLSLK